MNDENKAIMAAFGGGDNMPTAFSPQALIQSSAKIPKTSDKPFLTFSDGDWTYGASQDEVDLTALWAVNPRSFMFGLMEWCDGKPGGEVCVPMGTPYNADDVTFKHDPEHPKWNLAPQIGAIFVCLTGADKGLTVLYKTSTRGGVDALNGLAEKIGKQTMSDTPENYVPVVMLEFSTYQHKKYGKKWVPILNVQGWDDEDLSTTLEALAADEKPKGTSKRAAKNAEKAAESANASDDGAPPARRRRVQS